MARGLNKAMLIGNLGEAPDLKYTQAGDAVAKFSVATSEQWTDKNGEKQERTSWHRVTAFKKLAEICGEYLQKGSQVFIEGKINYSKYTDKDGVEKYSTEIIADQMQMLGGKPKDGEQRQERTRPARMAAASPAPGDDFADDDIPF